MGIVKYKLLQKKGLTQTQQEAWSKLVWFLFGAKRTGRSYLQAAITLDWLVENIGYELRYWDHANPQYLKYGENTLRLIYKIFEDLELQREGYVLVHSQSKKTLKINNKEEL